MERLTIPDVRIDEKTKKITVIDSNKVRENAMEIYWHLKEIEDILGDDYDLDRLRELVEADREGRCMDKKILDVTCGARSIWFDKHHPAAVYCDKRREQYQHLWKNAGNCTLDINPDVVCDFTDLPFPDNSFPLVVFDPPHLTGAKETAWLVKKYGKLDETWPKMLHDGFQECMRVLKPDGVLIFKWSEYDIPAAEVWKAIGEKPLFGHHSGKQSRTFWGCFMKLDKGEAQNNKGNHGTYGVIGQTAELTREAAEAALEG